MELADGTRIRRTFDPSIMSYRYGLAGNSLCAAGFQKRGITYGSAEKQTQLISVDEFLVLRSCGLLHSAIGLHLMACHDHTNSETGQKGVPLSLRAWRQGLFSESCATHPD